MSKSLGNVIAPQDVMRQSGADILRLWVVASDYAEDLRIGPEILKHMGDSYRRLRNTLRYLLGALAGYSPSEAVPPAEFPGEMPELDRWVLHRLAERADAQAFEVDDFVLVNDNESQPGDLPLLYGAAGEIVDGGLVILRQAEAGQRKTCEDGEREEEHAHGWLVS